MKQLLDTNEVARLLLKSPWWVRTNRKKLSIPSRLIGGVYRYDPDEILEWLNHQTS